MRSDRPRAPHLIWATRGRSWGFRFLLTAGHEDPLPTYEQAFGGQSDDATVWRREGATGALRFPDPLGRRDTAGRTIPHEFVLFSGLDLIGSVNEGIQQIWPLVEPAYASVWDWDVAPGLDDLVFGA